MKGMLQNPSKYQRNPVSHFLTLQGTQPLPCKKVNPISSGNASYILPNVPAINLNNYDHCHESYQRQSPERQQPLLVTQHQHPHKLEQIHTFNKQSLNAKAHARQHTYFTGGTGTTFDVGKSFTIAAILGLQSRKGLKHKNLEDSTSVINLSMNGGCDNDNDKASKNYGQMPTLVAHKAKKMLAENFEGSYESQNRKSFQNEKNYSNKNDCDITITTEIVTTTVNSKDFMVSAAHHGHSHHHPHEQHTLQQHLHQPILTHAHANCYATTASVVANGTPTALQNLQHHAQLANFNFSHEKVKSENHAKKSSTKNKRVRTIFTPEQLERLEAEFERQQYMVGPERLYLAHTLQLTEAQVKVWFQNRRIKWRKHHLELNQRRLALLRQNQLSTSNANASISSSPLPDANVTTASNSSIEENDETNNENQGKLERNYQNSKSESESELSVCNASMDSINNGGNT